MHVCISPYGTLNHINNTHLIQSTTHILHATYTSYGYIHAYMHTCIPCVKPLNHIDFTHLIQSAIHIIALVNMIQCEGPCGRIVSVAYPSFHGLRLRLVYSVCVTVMYGCVNVMHGNKTCKYMCIFVYSDSDSFFRLYCACVFRRHVCINARSVLS
jgi:hypothetical protein